MGVKSTHNTTCLARDINNVVINYMAPSSVVEIYKEISLIIHCYHGNNPTLSLFPIYIWLFSVPLIPVAWMEDVLITLILIMYEWLFLVLRVELRIVLVVLIILAHLVEVESIQLPLILIMLMSSATTMVLIELAWSNFMTFCPIFFLLEPMFFTLFFVLIWQVGFIFLI